MAYFRASGPKIGKKPLPHKAFLYISEVLVIGGAQ
jgi:hypothetical protein